MTLLSFCSVEPKDMSMSHEKLQQVQETLHTIAKNNAPEKEVQTKVASKKLTAKAAPKKVTVTATPAKVEPKAAPKPLPVKKIQTRETMPAEDYLYHFTFILDLDPALIEPQIEGRFSIVPRLVFSFVDEHGKIASPRFGEFFQVSPGATGYQVNTLSRGPFYIKYLDANFDDSLPNKVFPIKIEEIILREMEINKKLSTKGLGPFYIEPDEFETTYVITVDKLPNHVPQHPEGVFNYRNVRIARAAPTDD